MRPGVLPPSVVDPVFQKQCRGSVTEGGLQALAVVEELDVPEGRGHHVISGGKALPEEPLVFDAVEPALGRGDVPAVHFAAH